MVSHAGPLGLPSNPQPKFSDLVNNLVFAKPLLIVLQSDAEKREHCRVLVIFFVIFAVPQRKAIDCK